MKSDNLTKSYTKAGGLRTQLHLSTPKMILQFLKLPQFKCPLLVFSSVAVTLVHSSSHYSTAKARSPIYAVYDATNKPHYFVKRSIKFDDSVRVMKSTK